VLTCMGLCPGRMLGVLGERAVADPRTGTFQMQGAMNGEA